MGAEQFWISGWGTNASAAFQAAVEEAQYEYGRGGYTGTIAEKDSFFLYHSPEGVDPKTFASWVESYPGNVEKIPSQHLVLVERAAEVYDDKRGPAVCIPTEETMEEAGKTIRRFMFLGWAPS